MDNIKDKVVLITGAAIGIGYKTAEELLRNGAKGVAVLDLNASVGETSVLTLEKEFGKGRAIFVHCDVTKEEQFKEAFEKTLNVFGTLDIVINNAGILRDHLIELTININTTAMIRGSLLALDYMGKHKGGNGGTLVNIASVVGLHPAHSLPIYTASKYAVMGFSRCIQDFYDITGVRVLVMCPGVTVTALIKNIETACLDFISNEKFTQEFSTYPVQPVEHVACSMVELIQKGKNGQVCVSEDNQPLYAVEFKHYTETKSPLE
ncbi:hypothetical protein KM043_007954 [Ampulex compressa]|nr:hypothetical protein KM043_007954 [Ampulex compressa]